MAYEFKKLSDVNVIESISDSTNVLVEENGSIVKMAANSMIPEDVALKSDVVLAPTTASVGQTIVVKAVDESGKPTEWEAKDVSGGSAGGSDICIVTLGIAMTEDGKFMQVMDKTFDEVYGMLFSTKPGERKPLFLYADGKLYSYTYQQIDNGIKYLGFSGQFVASCSNTTAGVKYVTSATQYVWSSDGKISTYKTTLPAEYSTYVVTTPLNTPFEI